MIKNLKTSAFYFLLVQKLLFILPEHHFFFHPMLKDLSSLNKSNIRISSTCDYFAFTLSLFSLFFSLGRFLLLLFFWLWSLISVL